MNFQDARGSEYPTSIFKLATGRCQNFDLGRSKNTQVKAGSDPYFLRVMSMLGSGQVNVNPHFLPQKCTICLFLFLNNPFKFTLSLLNIQEKIAIVSLFPQKQMNFFASQTLFISGLIALRPMTCFPFILVDLAFTFM